MFGSFFEWCVGFFAGVTRRPVGRPAARLNYFVHYQLQYRKFYDKNVQDGGAMINGSDIAFALAPAGQVLLITPGLALS